MKIRTIETKTILLITTLTMLFATSLKAQQTNFSGIWTRNTDKCEVGDGLSINSIPIGLTINQNSSQLEITRNSKNERGESSSYIEKANFNGSPSTAIVKPNLNKKSIIVWSANHQQLNLVADYSDDQDNPLQKIKETWTLDNGKTLMIKAVVTVNDQEYTMTEIYDKK